MQVHGSNPLPCRDVLERGSDGGERGRVGCRPVQRQAGVDQLYAECGGLVALSGRRRWPEHDQDRSLQHAGSQVERIAPHAAHGISRQQHG